MKEAASSSVITNICRSSKIESKRRFAESIDGGFRKHGGVSSFPTCAWPGPD
jgi:hypothetical protein